MPKVFIIFGIGILFVILAVAVPLIITKCRRDTSIIESDEAAASARVIAVFDTGRRYNHNPVVKLTLKVIPPGLHPYQVDVETVISVVDVPAFQPGCDIRIKYKVNKPLNVMVIGKK